MIMRTPHPTPPPCVRIRFILVAVGQVGTCTNRWYDKLQLIVFENGAAGVNFEHTWVDGHTVLRFARCVAIVLVVVVATVVDGDGRVALVGSC